MEFQQLIYFKAAAECENLSRAAEKLYISQPALTRVIQRLESNLETELFERQGRSIRLNEYGRIVLAYTNEILQVLDNMQQALANEKSYSGGLHVITNLPNIVRYVIPSCMRENEGMKIQGQYEKTIDSAYSLLKSGICDIVISDRGEQMADLSCVPLLQDRMLLSVPEGHPLLEKGWVDFEDLNGLHLMDTQSTNATRSVQIMKEVLHRYHAEPIYVPVMDIGASSYLLSTSDYCCVYSAMTALFWMPPKRYNIPFRSPDAKIDYYALYLSKETEKCRPFLKWLKNWCLWANQMFISEYSPGLTSPT